MRSIYKAKICQWILKLDFSCKLRRYPHSSTCKSRTLKWAQITHRSWKHQMKCLLKPCMRVAFDPEVPWECRTQPVSMSKVYQISLNRSISRSAEILNRINRSSTWKSNRNRKPKFLRVRVIHLARRQTTSRGKTVISFSSSSSSNNRRQSAKMSLSRVWWRKSGTCKVDCKNTFKRLKNRVRTGSAQVATKEAEMNEVVLAPDHALPLFPWKPSSQR